MAVADQTKILDDKIKSNQAQYNLGREAVKISALQSKNLLDKYDFFFFFFLSGFSFTNIHDSQDSRGRGRVSI